MRIVKSWVGELVVIILAIAVMALIALHAVDRISKAVDAQIKAKADRGEVQR
jgi:hypothetical protein